MLPFESMIVVVVGTLFYEGSRFRGARSALRRTIRPHQPPGGIRHHDLGSISTELLITYSGFETATAMTIFSVSRCP